MDTLMEVKEYTGYRNSSNLTIKNKKKIEIVEYTVKGWEGVTRPGDAVGMFSRYKITCIYTENVPFCSFFL